MHGTRLAVACAGKAGSKNARSKVNAAIALLHFEKIRLAITSQLGFRRKIHVNRQTRKAAGRKKSGGSAVRLLDGLLLGNQRVVDCFGRLIGRPLANALGIGDDCRSRWDRSKLYSPISL